MGSAIFGSGRRLCGRLFGWFDTVVRGFLRYTFLPFFDMRGCAAVSLSSGIQGKVQKGSTQDPWTCSIFVNFCEWQSRTQQTVAHFEAPSELFVLPFDANRKKSLCLSNQNASYAESEVQAKLSEKRSAGQETPRRLEQRFQFRNVFCRFQS